MRVSIGFSGPAGTGVNTSGLLLGQLLSKYGYNILGDKEYASIIKGDNNNFFLYISDLNYFISNQIDYFFAFDDYAISKNEKIYKLKKTYNIKDQNVKFKNVFCFGVSLKILGINISQGKKLLEENFGGEILNLNFESLQQGYDFIKKSSFGLQDLGNPKKFMFGNEIVGKGSIASGMDFYGAYPMTPASSLIEVINDEFQRINLKMPENKKGVFFQGEDEIAVSMAMLGAKFTGKRAMCGTSGGGFALMTESISFSNQAEIGGVYVLSQRDGPSTGTPTFTGQADLNYALNASFGDTFPIVLAPSNFDDGYNLIGKALNRSDIYQHPVIFLIDKQFSESYLSISNNELKAEIIDRGKLQKQGKDSFKRYEFTQDGISPYTLPGTENGEFIATSYEHDEYGATNEEPNMKKLMQEKRFKKLETFIKKEFNNDFYGYEIVNPEAKKFFVTFGFNSYVIKEYINKGKGEREKGKGNSDFGLIVIKVMQPFDTRLKLRLHEHEKQIKKLIFVEMNYSGQLQNLIKKECNLNSPKREKKIDNFRKYNSYPIFIEEVKEAIKK
ncbi:MAG: hypothetical protein WC872_03275 [Candidatus Absconditabacterales bacterium]